MLRFIIFLSFYRYLLIISGFIILIHSSYRFGMTTNCDGIPDNTMALNLFVYQQIKFGNQILSCITSMMIHFTHFINSCGSFSQKYPLAAPMKAPITFYFHGIFFAFASFVFPVLWEIFKLKARLKPSFAMMEWSPGPHQLFLKAPVLWILPFSHLIIRTVHSNLAHGPMTKPKLIFSSLDPK